MSAELERYEGGEIVTRTDLRNRATDSWTDVLVQVGQLAKSVAHTDFVPNGFKGNIPAVAATIMRGREVGFQPMTALASLHSIKGRVGLSAEAMRALALQAGHEIVITESTSAVCTVEGRRKDSERWTKITWTIADARQAGLVNGENWKKYPRAMLQARASAELCRLAFPDVTAGLPSVEELEQYDVLPGAPALDQAGAGEGSTKVKRGRKVPKKPVERAEPPAPDLPSEEGSTAGAESDDGPGGGEAPGTSHAADSAPPLPGDEPVDSSAGDGGSDAEEADPPPGDASGPSGPPLPDDEEVEVVADEDVEVLDEGDAEPRLTTKQRNLLLPTFNRLGVTDRAERLYMSQVLIDRHIESANDLTKREAGQIIDALSPCKSNEDLQALINLTIDQREPTYGPDGVEP